MSALRTSATVRSIRSADIVVADYDTGLRLLASAQAQNSRIVLLTHNQSEAQIYRAKERGAHGYLLQGCSLTELIEGLRCVHAGVKALAPLAASRIADGIQKPALSKRELDILQQLTLGLSNKAIAHRLTVTIETVKTHVKSFFSKLDASTRTEAAAIARRRGILPEESESPHSKLHDGIREPLADARFEPQLGLVSADSPPDDFELRKLAELCTWQSTPKRNGCN
jgi:DNA-binding NarL/FixJ family response regulator